MVKYVIGSKIRREDMSNLWSTEDLLARDERKLLVWHHILNHCSLKSLVRLSKRGVITRNIIRIRKIPPCVTCLFGNSHKRPCRTKGKQLDGSIRKPLDTRPGSMTPIDQMVSAQPGRIPQVTGGITHARFLGIHCIHGALLRLLLRSPCEGGLS